MGRRHRTGVGRVIIAGCGSSTPSSSVWRSAGCCRSWRSRCGTGGTEPVARSHRRCSGRAFLLASIVQVWLAVRYAVHTEEISVLGLLAFLAVPSGILVMSFLLPQSDLDPQHDPEAAFGRVRPVFFGVLIGTVAINLVHSFVIGQRGLDFDLLFQCLLAAGGLTAAAAHPGRHHVGRGDDADRVRLHRAGLLDGRGGGPGAAAGGSGLEGSHSPTRRGRRHGVGQRLRDVDARAAAGRRRPQRGVDAGAA